MTQLNSVQMDSELAKYVAELEKRVRNLEDKFDSGKEVLTLQEAAQYMGIASSRRTTSFPGSAGTACSPRKRSKRKPGFTCRD